MTIIRQLRETGRFKREELAHRSGYTIYWLRNVEAGWTEITAEEEARLRETLLDLMRERATAFQSLLRQTTQQP
jgi:hypothetical protein